MINFIQAAPVKAAVIADLQRLGLGDAPLHKRVLLSLDPVRLVSGDANIMQDLILLLGPVELTDPGVLGVEVLGAIGVPGVCPGFTSGEGGMGGGAEGPLGGAGGWGAGGGVVCLGARSLSSRMSRMACSLSFPAFSVFFIRWWPRTDG